MEPQGSRGKAWGTNKDIDIMESAIIKQIQLKQYQMLCEVRRICDKYNIPYFLCCGTLLGAIRHKGPIPWDDDLDVGLLRNSYDLFIQKASKELNSQFFLQTWDTDKGYALPHCKIRDKNSHYIETVSKKSGCMDGISIDVLPFDAVPNNRIARFLHCYYLFDVLNIIKIKRGWEFIPESNVGILRKLVYRVLNRVTSEDKLIKKYESMQKRFNGKKHYTLVSETAGLDYFRFVDKKKNYIEMDKCQYMNDYFSVPKESDILLTNSYGNYCTLPPLEKRVGQPGVEKVVLNYDD